MAGELSSILGGLAQGFKDFGTGLVDMFGTTGAAIGDIFQSGGRSTKNQDDFRKWLYNTDSTKDAAAKGLGTILNGVSTVTDFIPGIGVVTSNPAFNGVQGAIGGIADELKMNGENADWGRAAQRAGVGAASGLASGYSSELLGKSSNKLINNGLTRGAVGGALGGGIANAGYTGIEGGDGGYGEAEYKWRGNSVVPFNANQIKNVSNKKPTRNANINYALTGLLGTGTLAAALQAATPKEDKKKKSEVK